MSVVTTQVNRPQRTMARRKQEDEFVLTLSDDEGLPLTSDLDSDSAPAQAPRGTKRKRAINGVKNKRQKIELDLGHQKGGDGPGVEPASDSEVDEERGVRDDAIDPDFEFDMGINQVLEDLEEFDGWGQDAADIKHKVGKRAWISTTSLHDARRRRRDRASPRSKRRN